jgi:Stage II sporulation protein E (SpoIIE)
MARSIRIPLFLAVIVACFSVSRAHAGPPPPDKNSRHFDAHYVGMGAWLGPLWLFSAEDSPAFSSPVYDDSNWETVSLEKPLELYGIPKVRYVWYRMHVNVRSPSYYLALETQYINGGCEIFVNGVRIGNLGRMDSSHQEHDQLTSFAIPDELASRGDLVIALRVALNKTGHDGLGTITPIQSGSIHLSVIFDTPRDASYAAAHQTLIPFVLSGLGFVVALVAFALFVAMRTRTEYLAIAVSLFATSFQLAEIGLYHLHGFNTAAGFWETFWLGVANVALIEFVRLILHLRRSAWLLTLEIALFLGYFAPNFARLGLFTGISVIAVYFVPSLVVQAVLPLLLVRGLIRGNRDARVVLPAIAVVSAANYWNFFSMMATFWRLPFPMHPLPVVAIGSYETDFWYIWSAIYFVTMLLFLVLRTIGIARQHARVAAEVEAARTVQHVLIPEEIPAIPGFTLESVYKPAGEVGGDFFQILPTAAGGVLVVIGDVSGKGIPAAMTVSLLVGTFRTLAHYTQNPSQILTAMNTRMLARSHGGFTTCLVLRADADGTLIVANAGHIAPYLEGQELPLESGLPLGIAALADYVESKFHIAPGQQLTLVTDGVVEARDKTGALFGFERMARLSIKSAEVIVEAALKFGQEDDITALTLMATVVPQPALA